ncbi:carboxymuconolactone decarboxylase family protein, partial [Salmonella enterica subsp. enterica serovar Montevideo]|nr:carboxymuconolactone decarboxylase family protein [Salmonella enterica subsp. enterica serovar Montevideo]
GGPTGKDIFELPFVLVETFLLLFSSITYGMAAIAMHKNNKSQLSPEVYSALVQAKNALEKSTLDPTLMELIYLRVSQINGCAFC